LSAQYERRNPGLIAVNRYGKRFCNEGSDYDSTWRSYLTWENWGDLGYRNLPAFHIFDQAYRDRFSLAGAAPGSELPDWVITAPTLAELADILGIDRDGLLAQVERFNHYASQGIDPDFHRGESAYDRQGEPDISATLAPLETGPFYGAEIAPGDLGTCGGLRVNGKAQVIDVFGQPIKRLFASGNTAGVGSPGALYGGGGGTLGPALTFAFIAGKQLAASIPGDQG
jgi:succinate dehydrogenase/fumarate reductase flavoprotein subunit